MYLKRVLCFSMLCVANPLQACVDASKILKKTQTLPLKVVLRARLPLCTSQAMQQRHSWKYPQSYSQQSWKISISKVFLTIHRIDIEAFISQSDTTWVFSRPGISGLCPFKGSVTASPFSLYTRLCNARSEATVTTLQSSWRNQFKENALPRVQCKSELQTANNLNFKRLPSLFSSTRNQNSRSEMSLFPLLPVFSGAMLSHDPEMASNIRDFGK